MEKINTNSVGGTRGGGEAMTEYRTGQTLDLHTPAHDYVDEQLGFTDRNYTVAAKTERFRIGRVLRRGEDFRLTLRDAGAGYGCGIYVSKWLAHGGWGRTIKVIE